MVVRIYGIAMLAMALLVGACTNSNGAEQTLVVENELMNTHIANVRETATVEADQMFITMEYAETQVGFVENQNQSIQATLVERGFSQEEIARVNPVARELMPTTAPTPSPAATSATSAVLTPTPTQQSNAPSLSSIVMAGEVGDNDCALDVRAQFSSSDERIYAVATASNIEPDTQIMSRWMREVDEVAVFDFTPDFHIESACIWFFIDQTDVTFTPGNWSVMLEMDGVPAAAPVTFTMVESE